MHLYYLLYTVLYEACIFSLTICKVYYIDCTRFALKLRAVGHNDFLLKLSYTCSSHHVTERHCEGQLQASN